MRNTVFPNWVTANIILNDAIDKYWGVRVTFGDKNISDVKVLFLDESIQWVIPEEDREHFVEKYNEFALFAHNELNIDKLFSEKFQYQPNDNKSRTTLKFNVEEMLEQFHRKNGYPFKNVLKSMLGIPTVNHVNNSIDKINIKFEF